MFSWEGVSEFVAVVELESFTAAAKRLGISTAQVSRQVSALEQRLAVKLFYRTTRKVSSTDIGKVYYQHCRQVLDGLDEAERAITELQTTPRGQLKITAPITYGEHTIAPLINEFAQQYPELEIQVVLSNAKLDLTAEGIDLAIRVGLLEDSTMIAKALGSRRLYVCASPAYIEENGLPRTLAELDQHHCLVGMHDYWQFLDKGKARNIRVRGRLSCNSGRALTDAALKGIGIVQLPDYYVQAHIKQGVLCPLLSQYQSRDQQIWLVYPNNRHLSSKVRLLVEFLSHRLS